MSPADESGSNNSRVPMIVRVASLTDANAVAQIYNRHVDIGGSTFDTTHWTDTQVRSLLEGMAPEVFLVAELDGVVVGWASARSYSLRHGYRFTVETAIYLDSAAIGTGIAHSLQQRLEEHCREQQIHHLVAKIAADNQRSISFHLRHGYELVGVQKEVGHMNGDWKDVAILQKLLPPVN